MADVFVGMEVDAELAPPLQRGRGLLLDAARDIGAEVVVDGINRTGAGITWKPWGELELLDGSGVNCSTVFNKTPGELPDNITQHAFALWHSLQCGAGSNWERVLSERVNFNMQLLRSASFAYELESGAMVGDHSLAADATIVSGTATQLLTAIVALENHFADVQPGARGTIHLTPGLLVAAVAGGIVEYRDGQYRTATDTVVLGDAGHTGQVTPNGGSAAGDSEAWIYITGDIWIAQLAPNRPEPMGDNVGEFVLLRNTDRPLSEMWGLITFDPEIVGAALVSNASGEGGAGGGGDASAANQTTMITALSNLVTNLGDADVNLEALETLITALNASAAQLEDALTADAATLSNVASQDTNINLLASNANRRGVIIHNDDTGILYVKYGSTASTTSYTYKIPADGTWEMPGPIYTGAIDAIWTTSGSGSARITELT